MTAPKTAGSHWPDTVESRKHVVVVEDGWKDTGTVIALAVSENDARFIARAMNSFAIMDATLRLVERHLDQLDSKTETDIYILARVRAAIKDPTT